MRKLILYTAMSLDGKIAGPNDDVSWLDEVPNPEGSDYGYTEFIANIDTTIMGNTSYQWVIRQDVPWPYESTRNYVVTRNKALEDNDEVSFINEDPAGFIRDMKAGEGKDIWLIGGAGVNQLCLEAGLIDEMRVFLMPVIVGEGIGLFNPENNRQMLELIYQHSYPSGVLELRYRPKA